MIKHECEMKETLAANFFAFSSFLLIKSIFSYRWIHGVSRVRSTSLFNLFLLIKVDCELREFLMLYDVFVLTPLFILSTVLSLEFLLRFCRAFAVE